jgi:hypothetical protein
MVFVKNNNLISKNQTGFMEKNQSADHIFTLKSIIDSYKSKNKKFLPVSLTLKRYLILYGDRDYSIYY